MARGRRPKRRAAPAPPQGLGLARIVGRIAAFLEAGGGRLLRWVAAALLRGLARARWGVVEAAGRGDGGVEGQRDGAEAHDAAHDDDKLLRAEDKFGDDSCAITGREVPSSATAAALVQEDEEDEPADESATSGVKKATALAPLVQEDAAEESATAGVKNATAPAPLVEEDGLGEDRTAGAANNAAAAAAKKPKRKAPLPRPRPPPPDPFEEGYNIAELYREHKDRDDEVALSYAMFCWQRKLELTDKKKDWELCDICFFHRGKASSFHKQTLYKHCTESHGRGFLCESTGCMVRCKTLREAGLHRYYLHEQSSRDWWRYLLEKHGIDV